MHALTYSLCEVNSSHETSVMIIRTQYYQCVCNDYTVFTHSLVKVEYLSMLLSSCALWTRAPIGSPDWPLLLVLNGT